MSNAEHLNSFLQRVTSDATLTTIHIGFCAALAGAWIESGFTNPFNISRSQLMKAARIKSKTTYHKVIRDLILLNYLRYTPSFHPAKGSLVDIL